MKKWLISLLAVSIVVGGVSAPSHAGLFGKKKPSETEAQTETTTTEKPEKRGFFHRHKDEPAQEQASQTQESPDTLNNTTETPSVQAQAPAQENMVITPKVELQSPLSSELDNLKVEDPVDSHMLPPDKTFVAVDDPTNPLGVSVSANKLNDAASLISQKRYTEASKMLAPLKDWLVDATEAHINLHKTLKGLPSAQVQAELEKQLALQFALLRDKSFFQLGMLAIGQKDYATAVRNLSKVVQSQPRSPMGVQAYEVLQQVGFTEKIQLREERKN